ncbi:MAG: 3-methyl-2-oxobutanoate hydroxymethyltransferase [Planctomycetota bacterium]
MEKTVKNVSKSRVSSRTLRRMRERGEMITMLTAYDFPTAKLIDESGIDVLLVGDSMGMVVQGHDTTLPVTMDQMIYHAEMVGRAVEHAMVVVDLPFPDGQLSIEHSIRCGVRVLKETRCQAVKLEGGSEQADRIAAMVTAGVPVMAHVGLRPQNIHVDGGYRLQRDTKKLVDDAKAAEAAGAFAVLIECVPAEAASTITAAVSVPTIGIGAGRDVSGQVLVTHDILGLTSGYTPKFTRNFAPVGQMIRDAVTSYRDAVRERSFPSDAESF